SLRASATPPCAAQRASHGRCGRARSPAVPSFLWPRPSLNSYFRFWILDFGSRLALRAIGNPKSKIGNPKIGLFLNLGDDAGADGAATLADGEAQTLLDRHRHD